MTSGIVEPKPGADMGRVTAMITVSNAEDQKRAVRGEIQESQVRQITCEALVDSGATFLCMPESMIQQLGLDFHRERDTKTVLGNMAMKIYGNAIIEVQGRACHDEILALPEHRQVLLGQIPLEKMDWWIDLNNRRLVGNPEHGGQWMAEVF